MSETNTYLFDDFQALSTSDWMEKITKDLKGADFEKKLVRKTLDGITIKPFYREEDIKSFPYTDILPGQFPYIRGNEAETCPAEVHADICFKDIDTAAADAKDFVDKGVTSLGFKIYTGKLLTESDLGTLLSDIDTQAIKLHFAGNTDMLSLVKNLTKVLSDPTSAQGSIDLDPLGNVLLQGSCCNEKECRCFDELKSILDFCEKHLPKFKLINVQAKHLRNAGATAMQELAFGMSIANEYMALLTDEEYKADMLTGKMMFSFGIGSDYFMEIAKLRAARLLWSKIVTAYLPDKPEAAKTHFHSETTLWNKTVYDAYVNLLRTTTESMAALLGGTDSLSVMPFDLTYKAPDAFSKRIARNIQIILGEEAKFDRVKDPAAGAYYIEYLTHELAEGAWELFKETEKRGGFSKAAESGFIQAEIKKITDERDRRIAMGREVILGTNQFPDSAEYASDKIDENMYNHYKYEQNGRVQTLKMYRGAEAFETMRLRTEKARKRPAVFLLTIGNRAMRTARASFAGNFFGAAGFKIINNLGFESIAKGMEAARKTKSDIVVLCSDDKEYAEYLPQLLDSLKGDKMIPVLAGYPKEYAEEFKKIGLKHFIHLRSDILNSLISFQEELGI